MARRNANAGGQGSVADPGINDRGHRGPAQGSPQPDRTHSRSARSNRNHPSPSRPLPRDLSRCFPRLPRPRKRPGESKAPESPVEPESPEPPAEPEEEGGEEATYFRFFSPSSIWNTQVPTAAPLDPDSTAIVGAFNSLVASELGAKTGPSISTSSNQRADLHRAGQPTDRAGAAGKHLRSAGTERRLERGAIAAHGPARTRQGSPPRRLAAELRPPRGGGFWHLVDGTGGWQAGWGGAMQSASSNFGVYGGAAWPGANGSWGGTASSLSIACLA